jgi:hypothetical protein
MWGKRKERKEKKRKEKNETKKLFLRIKEDMDEMSDG